MSNTYSLKVSGDFTRLESQADFDEWCKLDNVRVFEKYHKPLSFPCAAMTVDEMIDVGAPPYEYQETVPVPHFLYPGNVRGLAELLPELAENEEASDKTFYGKETLDRITPHISVRYEVD